MTEARRRPNPLKAFFNSLVLSALALGVLLVGDRRAGDWRRAQAELAELEARVGELKSRNFELSRRIAEAGRSDFEAESNARLHLGLARAGDVVFVLPDRVTATGRSSAPPRN